MCVYVNKPGCNQVGVVDSIISCGRGSIFKNTSDLLSLHWHPYRPFLELPSRQNQPISFQQQHLANAKGQSSRMQCHVHLYVFWVWCMQVAALHVYNEAEEHRRIYLPSMDRFCHFNRSMRKSVTIPLCRKWKEVVTWKGFFRIATFLLRYSALERSAWGYGSSSMLKILCFSLE